MTFVISVQFHVVHTYLSLKWRQLARLRQHSATAKALRWASTSTILYTPYSARREALVSNNGLCTIAQLAGFVCHESEGQIVFADEVMHVYTT